MADVLPFRVGGRTDAGERERALDIRASWIVEAPAGSGKTGLLIQRYLKLLGDEGVEEPEQVLAITFTNKATAEMRERVVEQLAGAAAEAAVKEGFERQTRELAEAVLRRNAGLGWGLLERPRRLRIQTIDAVCAEIARVLPVLSGSGGRLRPVPEAEGLYREAARRTLMLLGGEDGTLNAALRTMLLHRDGNLKDCEKLIAEMLGSREQWGRLIPLRVTELTDEYLDGEILPKLERALELAICQALTQLARTMPEDVLRELTATAEEFAHFDGYDGGASHVALCANRHEPPEARAEHLAHWRALIHLLVTPSSGTWRKGFARNYFKIKTDRSHTARLTGMIERLQDREGVLEAMCRLDKLPPASYPPEQWAVAKALFRVLSRALVELQIVFAGRGECDFAEMGLAARAALAGDPSVEDLSAALGRETKHLLVDEMQDTSSGQYELIERLTHGWDGRSQTLFLVGDPKQSIYRFRQARVERFVRTMKEQRLGEVTLGCLRLTANFRSQRRLVERFNEDFSRLFPREVDLAHPEEAPYLATVAVREASDAEGAAWHTSTISGGEGKKAAARRQALRNARSMRDIARRWLAKPLPHGRTAPWRVAVLLRSRNHLGPIAAELKKDDGGGAVPYFSTEIDALGTRQEVLDLFGLTRALLHPADRVAWLAVLHAPWCGLGLADLHLLAGADEPELRQRTLLDLMGERGHLLSEEGEARVARVWPVLKSAMEQRGRITLAQEVERTWRSLGGHAYLDAEERANAMRYFRLLDELKEEGGGVNAGVIQERMKKLYAEATPKDGAVELITMHKAKGLEWDVVMIPALEKRGQTDRGKLMDWMEVDSGDGDAAQFVLAPIAMKGEKPGALPEWIRSVHAAREAAERKRLLYVAYTRAREELHLFAAPERKADGSIWAEPNSLLASAWPVAEAMFRAEDLPDDELESHEVGGHVADLAAGGNEIAGAEGRPPMLKRVPLEYDPMERFCGEKGWQNSELRDNSPSPLFDRPEGSLAARAFGNAVHAFLEVVADRMVAGAGAGVLAVEIPGWLGRVAAVLRGDGLAPAMVERMARRVIGALQTALGDADGRWILEPHPGAANEVSLTGWKPEPEAPRMGLRLDRVFRAGSRPGESGEEFLWIVDYKTATHGVEGLDEFIAGERRKYQPQLEAYARGIGRMGEATAGVRLALYYPVLGRLEWWAYETS